MRFATEIIYYENRFENLILQNTDICFATPINQWILQHDTVITNEQPINVVGTLDLNGYNLYLAGDITYGNLIKDGGMIIPYCYFTLQKIDEIPATCTQNGCVEHRTCKDCSKIYSDMYCQEIISVSDLVIPAIGHKAGSWKTILEPTPETEGKKIKECLSCGVTLEEAAIAKLPKEPVKADVINQPTQTTISYGDAIILHVDASKIPAGGRVEWSADNGNFNYSANGDTCRIDPNKSGSTTFTATIYDAQGNAVTKEEQVMTSKADPCRRNCRRIFSCPKRRKRFPRRKEGKPFPRCRLRQS